MIHYHKYRGGFWFRIFGYGLSIVNRRIHPPPFSERNGFRKPLKLCGYAINLLKKDNP